MKQPKRDSAAAIVRDLAKLHTPPGTGFRKMRVFDTNEALRLACRARALMRRKKP